MRSALPRLAVLIAGVIIPIACADGVPVGLPPSQSPPAHLTRAGISEGGVTLDTHWEWLAVNRIPGFAGYYLDQEGRSVVLLLADMESQELAMDYMRETLPRLGLSADANVAFRHVKYGFDRLRREHDRVYAAIGNHDGWVQLDVDERENRLYIGAVDDAARIELAAVIDTLDLPSDILEIGISPRGGPRTDVDDRVRSVVAGVQIDRSEPYSELAPL